MFKQIAQGKSEAEKLERAERSAFRLQPREHVDQLVKWWPLIRAALCLLRFFLIGKARSNASHVIYYYDELKGDYNYLVKNVW